MFALRRRARETVSAPLPPLGCASRFPKGRDSPLYGFDPERLKPYRGIVRSLLPACAPRRYAPLRTTYPAQTPVAWSTFATGTNPGGHGIFDFIRRDPRTYLPDFSLNRYEQKNAYLPPGRQPPPGHAGLGAPSAAGIPSLVLRCPCTFPPDKSRPDALRHGRAGPARRPGDVGTFYTSRAGVKPGESEQVVHVTVDAAAACERTSSARGTPPGRRLPTDLVLEPEPAAPARHHPIRGRAEGARSR